MNRQPIVYADHSATTKVRREVLEGMLPLFKDDFGNSSSIHTFGQKAKRYLEEARIKIASVINAKEEQIFFTSGGTESDNLVIQGVSRLFEDYCHSEYFKGKEKHIISTKIEHPAVLEPLKYLSQKGWRISFLNVDTEGFIRLDELNECITTETLLVSVIHANNEIGTIQDLKKISLICKKYNVLFHTDAVQSFCKVPVDVGKIDIDFISMSGHKIYGPKGVGALYVKSKDLLSPLFIGGGQESKIRPGTENIPGIVGFSTAAILLNNEMKEYTKILRKWQVDLMEMFAGNNGIIITGPLLGKIRENLPEEKYMHRLSGHVSLCCKDVEGESLIIQANLKNIAISSGSACSSGSFEPSHVLVASGVSEEFIRGSLRISFGKENSEEDIQYIYQSLEEILKHLNAKKKLKV